MSDAISDMHQAVGSVRVRTASEADLLGVLSVQYEAFTRVSLALGIPAEKLPPLQERREDLAALIASGTVFFVAEAGEGRIIGSVRAKVVDGVVEVGRLVVDGSWLRQGVATSLMDLAESYFPGAMTFRLFTGVEALEPLALYHGRGYREVRRERTPATELVWLEKWRESDVEQS